MTVAIRPMTPADIPLGMRLKAQNLWNQLEADWVRQLTLSPDGCFVAEVDGSAVGTACATIFGPVAWIAMVLVDADHRGRGVGGALMRHVVATLDTRGVKSIRLDATPLGQPVYEKIGFVAEFLLHRYEGVLASRARPQASVVSVQDTDLNDILALDRRVTGTDRRSLLTYLFREYATEWRILRESEPATPASVPNLIGFLAARPGARAWQIGPCQGTADACRQLLLDVCARHAGQAAFLDVPDDHAEARAFAAELGLVPQRPLLRMGRGPRIHEDIPLFWTSFGPEKG